MEETEEIRLPASGLAEDILSRFDIVPGMEEECNDPQTDKPAVETACMLVGFRLASEEYGLEISGVREIIRATGITPVPGAPPHVKGVISLRGRIIPVVDLRKRLALPEIDNCDSQRIIVVESSGKRQGMLVDSVTRVMSIHPSLIENIPVEVTMEDNEYIKGIGKPDDGMVIILEPGRLLLS